MIGSVVGTNYLSKATAEADYLKKEPFLSDLETALDAKATNTYVDNTFVTKTAYNSDKQTFATKTELNAKPSTSDVTTAKQQAIAAAKDYADETFVTQTAYNSDKQTFATKTELNAKPSTSDVATAKQEAITAATAAAKSYTDSVIPDTSDFVSSSTYNTFVTNTNTALASKATKSELNALSDTVNGLDSKYVSQANLSSAVSTEVASQVPSTVRSIVTTSYLETQLASKISELTAAIAAAQSKADDAYTLAQEAKEDAAEAKETALSATRP